MNEAEKLARHQGGNMTQEREAFSDLPPLPEPRTLSRGDEDGAIQLGYTADQMHAYARASLAQPASPTIQDLAAGAHYPQATGWSNPAPNAAANAGAAASSASVGVAQPASVPAGWKLVPVEPTDDMLANVDEEVGGHCHSCTKWNASWSDCRRVYAAMLAAAPQAPQPAQAVMAPEYAAAVRELAEQSGMSEAQVLRAAVRLYQAEQKGLVTVEHKEQIGPLSAPQPEAQPQKPGWKLAAFPVEWTPGSDWFKDWASNWFGPDADDDHLRRAVQELLAAAPSAQAEPYRCPAKRGEDPQVCGRVRCQLGRKCADEVQAEQGGK